MLLAVAVACGERDTATWLGTVDTLESGTVVIRNPSQGLWGVSAPWRLAEELKIGTREGAGPEAFGKVVDIEVDGQGRIYVLDLFAQDVRVFNRDGSYVRTFGGHGRGPGELSGANGMAFDPAGRLWVLNQNNMRYSVFDTTGTLLEEPRREMAVRIASWAGVFDRQGALYDLVYYHVPRSTFPRSAYARYDTTRGQFVDTMPAGMGYATAPIFWGVHAKTPYGWWAGSATEYRLYHIRFAQDTARIVERPYDPIRLSVTDADSAAKLRSALWDQLKRLPRDRQPPEGFYPIFLAFVEDDERYLWVMLTPPSGYVPGIPNGASGARFDVFDPDGRYLGEVVAPYRLEPSPSPVIRDGKIYALVKGELDVPFVVTLRIDGRN